MYKPPDTESSESSVDDKLIEYCAAALVSFDRRANARDQIQDADKLLHQLVLPMSIPWGHSNKTLHKAIHFDIEDCPAILRADCSKPEYREYGEFRNLLNSGQPKSVQVAARRSEDPGVVEFTSFFQPSIAQIHHMYSPTHLDPLEGDPSLPGELSLRLYNELLERKRKRQKVEHANLNTLHISLRLGSTSTRSTILKNSSKQQGTVLVLLAIFPKSIQEGLRMSGPNVFKVAEYLGSYNARLIPHEAFASEDTSCKNRIVVGRTRLIWCEKEIPQSSSQRVPYRSLLTGDRLEASKRPLRVKVAIRINGEILSSNVPSAKKTAAAMSDASIINVTQLLYGNKIVSDALNTAGESELYSGKATAQCGIDSERLLLGVSRRFISRNEAKLSSLLSLLRKEWTIQEQTLVTQIGSVINRGQLHVVPPCIDCIPSEDGLQCVVCTKAGTLTWRRHTTKAKMQPNHKASTLILHELAIKAVCCSICWKHDEALLHKRASLECKSCKLRVHTSCLLLQQSSLSWTCQSCKRDDDEAEPLCRLCHLPGGELVKLGDSNWVHDVCQRWCTNHTSENSAAVSSSDDMRCHICSESTSAVARCSAPNCTIQFHPICGVIASITAKFRHEKLSQGTFNEHDAFLCSQYCFYLLRTSVHRRGKGDISVTLPVAFCGFHNPDRREDMIGVYPGGFNEKWKVVRIPTD